MQKRKPVILAIVLTLLILIGLMMIASAEVVYSNTRFDDPYHFFKRQVFVGLIPGLILFYIFYKIPYKKLKTWALPLFVVSVVVLALVFVPGIGITSYGATRWLNFGFFTFQPSEFVKLTVILYLSAWLSSRGRKNVSSFSEGLLPFVGVLGILSVLIYAQPDVGTLGLIAIIAVSIFFVAGATFWHLVGLGASGLVALVAIIKAAPYRWERFIVFLNPGLDPQGRGYQINQALIAIGSGGLFGFGLGESRQKFNYLPEPAGDSIFAIIGEEFGFIGAVVIIILYLVIAYKGFMIASHVRDDFARLTCVGITTWIVVQAFINIGAIVGLIPLTGMPLPFVSYGGTSLVFSLIAMGILMNIDRNASLKE